MELLLDDWFPRKMVADAAYLAKLPDLVRGFIRYCHDPTGHPVRTHQRDVWPRSTTRNPSTRGSSVGTGPKDLRRSWRGLFAAQDYEDA